MCDGIARANSPISIPLEHLDVFTSCHPFLVEMPCICMKRFVSTFIMRTIKEWISLLLFVLLKNYKPEVLKRRVNRLLFGKLAVKRWPSKYIALFCRTLFQGSQIKRD